jgi:transcription-repair coupling factor (superfamily II helicase)
MKHLGMRLGWHKIRIKNGKLLGYFPNETNQGYYTSELFGQVMARVNQHNQLFSLKQKGNQLLLITEQQMKSIPEFVNCLQKLL